MRRKSGGGTPGAASKKAGAKARATAADDADSPPVKSRRVEHVDDPAAGGESVAALRDHFNKLMDVRMTKPERELKEHIEVTKALEAKHAEIEHELKNKLGRLEKSSAELEKARKDLVEQKKQVLEAQEQSRAANERAAIAESELKSVRAALDVLASNSADQETVERLSATLDAYKELFGCVLIVEPDNHGDVGASFYNTASKKVARMRLKVQADRSIVFTALANDRLLPDEFRSGEVAVAQPHLPAAAAKILMEIAKI